MPLVPALELLAHARSHGYAVGYFESWNLESLQGVVDAAEARRSPVFIGFNGGFLSRPERLSPQPLSWYAALGRAAADVARVPCGLVFNECANDAWVRQAAELGFGLVMPDDPGANPGAFTRRVRDLAAYAHERGVAIEAEVGHLPSGASGAVQGAGALTDPDQAAAFAEATGIDLMAVSVGNVHVLLDGARGLDLEHLAALRRRVDLPFDLHGGTGIAEASLRGAIGLGVAKVCYGTYLKQRWLRAVRDRLAADPVSPHALLGEGGPEDVLVAGRQAVRDAVLERLDWLGCGGRA